MIFLWPLFEIRTFPRIVITGKVLLFMFFSEKLCHSLRFAERADKAIILNLMQAFWVCSHAESNRRRSEPSDKRSKRQ